jgi:hypothetical protein
MFTVIDHDMANYIYWMDGWMHGWITNAPVWWCFWGLVAADDGHMHVGAKTDKYETRAPCKKGSRGRAAAGDYSIHLY